MAQEMTPEQALNTLDKVVAQVAMPRLEHIKLQLAIDTLAEAIQLPAIEESP